MKFQVRLNIRAPWAIPWLLSPESGLQYWPSFVVSSHTHFVFIHPHFIHANLYFIWLVSRNSEIDEASTTVLKLILILIYLNFELFKYLNFIFIIKHVDMHSSTDMEILDLIGVAIVYTVQWFHWFHLILSSIKFFYTNNTVTLLKKYDTLNKFCLPRVLVLWDVRLRIWMLLMVLNY